ncbi:MAC/Perforin domain-containing protein [Artemisia annua]|uniref:MAC/Perforin domain-containing protein n=1 Tax=Artemisia annua TaxID=35608 RepID=A0A2U1KIJ5_ARTAN|nr:MAC/Perforin domain-containing protein [Artemisia annua]
MARYFNMKSNLIEDVPLGSFNAMFYFTGSRQVDASSTKSLAMIGYVVPLYEVRLENSDLVLLQEVKRVAPYSWDGASLASCIRDNIPTSCKLNGLSINSRSNEELKKIY